MITIVSCRVGSVKKRSSLKHFGNVTAQIIVG